MADEPKNSFYNLSFYDRLLKIRLSNREIVSNWLYLIHHLFFSCVCPCEDFFHIFSSATYPITELQTKKVAKIK